MRRLKRLLLVLLVLFLVGVPGIDAVDPQHCAGHGALNGNVWLLGITSRIALDQRSRSRNRRYRGRSDDRQ